MNVRLCATFAARTTRTTATTRRTCASTAASVCTSVNDVLCHGIPDNRPLKNRDFVNFDVTLYINGVYGDTSAMVCVGNVHEDVKKLIEVT